MNNLNLYDLKRCVNCGDMPVLVETHDVIMGSRNFIFLLYARVALENLSGMALTEGFWRLTHDECYPLYGMCAKDAADDAFDKLKQELFWKWNNHQKKKRKCNE